MPAQVSNTPSTVQPHRTTTFIGPFHPILTRHCLPSTSHTKSTDTKHTLLSPTTSPRLRLYHSSSSIMTTTASNGTVSSHGNPNADNATASNTNTNTPKATVSLRTCRQCKKSYDPSKNHPTACRYHSGIYTGDSKRKGGVSNDGYSTGDGAVERFWWCCGETDINAPGCVVTWHKSYDDDE